MTIPRRTMAETLTASQRTFMRLPETAFDDRANSGHEVPLSTFESSVRGSEPTAPAWRPVPRRLHAAKRAAAASRRPEPLRSVTLRLRTSVAKALRRTSMERSLDYAEPFSQQAIVEAAIRDWLQSEGYPVAD